MTIGKVTGAQVKESMISAGITSVLARGCSICGSELIYLREGTHLFFNSNCGCTAFITPPKEREWSSVADLINMQSNDETKKNLMTQWGLKHE